MSATFPLVLEVIQDGVSGAAPRAEDGLVLGGRSSAGYLALASGGFTRGTAAGDARSAIVTVSLNLQLQVCGLV